MRAGRKPEPGRRARVGGAYEQSRRTQRARSPEQSRPAQGGGPSGRGIGSRVRRILVIGLALAGIAALAYPAMVNRFHDEATTADWRTFVAARSADPVVEDLYRFLTSENARLAAEGQAGLVDAFSYETPGVDLRRYGIADNRIGFIDIPSAGIRLPIHLGATRENLRLGAAHLTQTSYPVGGTDTNAVIAGHRGQIVKMLRHLDKVQPGDLIFIDNFRERLTYRAVESRIIQPTDIEAIKIQPGRDLITLITCDPVGLNYQRYAVYAERVNG